MKPEDLGFRNIQASLAGISKALSESLAPLISATSHIKQTSLNFQSLLPTFSLPIFEFPESVKEVLRQAGIEDECCKRIEKSGWIPHESSPWDLASDENLAPEQLKTAIEDYYITEWDRVAAILNSRVSSYSIDDEAKATFFESVHAHGQKLFRCAPRILFPEIERVSRAEIHNGRAKTPITSQKDLQSQIGEMTPAEMAPLGMAGFRFYMKLTNHVYLQTDKLNDTESLNAVLIDPVPNRHVALHGLASYSTFQSSLNAIILTDYIFHAVTKIKLARAA